MLAIRRMRAHSEALSAGFRLMVGRYLSTAAWRLPAIVAGLSLAGAAHAASSPLDYVATMNGKCSHLVYGGRDGSKACVPKVVNDVHKDGRTGFTFLDGNIAVVTFSGAADQVKDDPNTVTQPLDEVVLTLTGPGASPKTIKVTGSCLYTNPYAGPGKVDCTAHTGQGSFEASFVSDGQAPSMQRF
jgi:hypothetical protein